MAASFPPDMASMIARQVEYMIVQARKGSEARVQADLKAAKHSLSQMDEVVQDLTAKVARCLALRSPDVPEENQPVERPYLESKISELEQKWGTEVKALKQDLHRTILAHNHNSDLMRHHRDALDEARRSLDANTKPTNEQVEACAEKVERILRAGQSKQRTLESLTERLSTVEQQIADLLPPQLPLGGIGPPGLSPHNETVSSTVKKSDTASMQPQPAEELSDEALRARFLQAAAAKQGPDASALLAADDAGNRSASDAQVAAADSPAHVVQSAGAPASEPMTLKLPSESVPGREVEVDSKSGSVAVNDE